MCYNRRKKINTMKLLSDYDKRKLIEKLDLEIWSAFAPEVKPGTRPGIVYHCYCPYCQIKQKKIKETTHNLTAVVYRNQGGWGQQGDGFGFFCASCDTKHPRVYAFLGGEGSPAAEEYAWKRFEAECVGKGWYCPYPKRWKELSDQAVKARAEKYRADYEQRRKSNMERCGSTPEPSTRNEPLSATERAERKQLAREIRRQLIISPRESSNPFPKKDPASKETGH
jgi:hypothetical protein